MTKKERERRKENSFYNSELARLQKNVVRAQYDVLFYKNGKEAADKMFFYNAWSHRYRGLALGEPKAKSYEKAKSNLKKDACGKIGKLIVTKINDSAVITPVIAIFLI